MGTNITFYATPSAPNVLDKDISVKIGTAHTIQPTNAVNMLSPTLVIDYDSSLINANYCYIELFDRYYWCSISIDTASRMIIQCTCDYLMSWKNHIKNCNANIVRSESVGVNYVVDDMLPIDPNRFFVEGVEFPGDPLTYSDDPAAPIYLLVVNGVSGNE